MPSSSLHYFLSHVQSRIGRIHLSPDHTASLYKTGGTCLLQTKQTAGKQQLPISALDALSGNSQNLLHQSKMCHRSHRLWILFFPPLPRLLQKDGNQSVFSYRHQDFLQEAMTVIQMKSIFYWKDHWIGNFPDLFTDYRVLFVPSPSGITSDLPPDHMLS